MAMMYAHFNEEPKPLREIRPDIPEDLEATVLRMLAKDPEKRWAKIDDVFGTPVMAHDDPARQQLIELAQASPNATMAAQLSTPTSPIPPARRTSVRPSVSASTTEAVLPAETRSEPPAAGVPGETAGVGASPRLDTGAAASAVPARAPNLPSARGGRPAGPEKRRPRGHTEAAANLRRLDYRGMRGRRWSGPCWCSGLLERRLWNPSRSVTPTRKSRGRWRR